MTEFIDVLHSFNCGDLITTMCGLREVSRLKDKKVRIFQRLGFEAHYYDGQVNSTVNDSGESVCMNERLFKMLHPLIMSQDFVESFEIYNGQKIHYNFDLTRDSKAVAMPSGTIHSWYMTVFPEMNCDPSKTWISGIKTDPACKDMILVNRTMRYNNPYINYFFLKPYEDRVIFCGTPDEYKHFNNEWNLNTTLLVDKDFLETATVIKSVKVGLYGQSFAFHLADSLKAKRILELCTVFPNTFCNGANGAQFYHQSALEYHFKEMMK